MPLVLIAALDRHRAIGCGNALPWHLPTDLKRFKALTLGKPLLMGRKTAASLGRTLPGRRNLVLTRSSEAPFEGMETVTSLDAALEIVGDQELMVIGGGEIYALALPFATRMHLTHVDTIVPDADAFFPEFDATQWQATSREPHAADAKHAFAFGFVDYERKL
jgi:dihydrofolate reductase